MVQQGHRFERNFNTRPYCTYCKRLGHLAYNCFQRTLPFNVRQPGPLNRTSFYPTPEVSSDVRTSGFRQRSSPPSNDERNNARNANVVSLVGPMQSYPTTQNVQSGYSMVDSSTQTSTESVLDSHHRVWSNKSDIATFKFANEDDIKRTLHNSVCSDANIYLVQPLLESEVFNDSLPKKLLIGSVKIRLSYYLRSFILLVMSFFLSKKAFFKRFLFINLILSLFVVVPPVILANNPLLCQVSHSGMIWKLPTFPDCPQVNFSAPNKLQKVFITVYRPNIIMYHSRAYACRIVHKKIFYYTSIFNVKHSRSEVKNILTTTTMCRHMVLHKNCLYGNMIIKGEIYHTDNSLNFDYPFPLFGSFSEKSVEAFNCYMFETVVTASYEGHLSTP